jgi:hypothetical protein
VKGGEGKEMANELTEESAAGEEKGGKKDESADESFETVNPANDYDDLSFTYLWKNKVEILIDENINTKIVDFGNACWTYKVFFLAFF